MIGARGKARKVPDMCRKAPLLLRWSTWLMEMKIWLRGLEELCGYDDVDYE